MAINGAAVEELPDSVSDERYDRYLLEYEMARLEAATAALELQRILASGARTHAVAAAAKRNHLASARLYAAAQCLVSPP